MADFPAHPSLAALHTNVISTCSPASLAGVVIGTATAAWPAANDALFVPFRIDLPVTVYKMACGTGTGTTGNFDLGIYDLAGNRLVSTGSTAKTTASSERIVDVTDTLLLPGMYYLAMATDGTTSYVGGVPGAAGLAKLMGCRKMASAFALPSTATYATVTAAYVPNVAAYLRSE